MAKNPDQLTKKQIEVLSWVRDGCPAGEYPEGNYEHRISARALERRGLVSISGQGPSWKAKITKAGRARLEKSGLEEIHRAESEAEQLIQQVLAAGGELQVARDEESRYKKLVSQSFRSPLRPHGKKLATKRRGDWFNGDLFVVFVPHFRDEILPKPVLVPKRVAKYHPAVKAYLERKDWHYASANLVPRAARVLHALAIEAERRGYEVRDFVQPPSPADRSYRDPKSSLHLGIVSGEHVFGVRVKEVPGTGGAKVDYGARFYGKQRVPRWQEPRLTEFVPTGRLEVEISGPGISYDGEHFRDARSKTVEGKLPQLFVRIEECILEAEWRQEQAALEAAERQRLHELAVARARQEYERDARWEHFKQLAEGQADVMRLRRFLSDAQEAMTHLPLERRDEARFFFDEVKARIDELDALTNVERLLPLVSEPTSSDLEKYLQ